eukprot:GSChrysophyteH2.ASY1.ANO1.505.1 assembled CDS
MTDAAKDASEDFKLPPAQLIGLISITMVALAANSILTRAGIADYLMDPLAFAGMRLASGAATLAVIVLLSRVGWGKVSIQARIFTASFLIMYLIPFSLAYLTLPSGLGALVLFGIVQITMFAASAVLGKKPSGRQWAGMVVAMAGLAWILWPKDDFELDYAGVFFMIVSGLGWGMFCVRGKGSKSPLYDMAVSFVLCLPVAIALMLFCETAGHAWSVSGALCAGIAGSLMSGLGYSLWYFLLPFIPTAVAAITQLSVPPIAMVMGVLALGEKVTLEVALGSVVVLGGIGMSVEHQGGSAQDAAKDHKDDKDDKDSDSSQMIPITV